MRDFGRDQNGKLAALSYGNCPPKMTQIGT